MKVKALREFSSVRFGNVSVGQVLEMPEGQVKQLEASRLVEVYETKVVPQQPDAPKRTRRRRAPSSASRPAPASPQTTASTSDAGETSIPDNDSSES